MMKKIIAFAFYLGLIHNLQAQITPLAKERVVTVNGKQSFVVKSKLKAILIGDFTYGYNHILGSAMLDSTIARIGRTENPPWQVDWIQGNSEVASKITTKNLSKYQVFFGNNISGWGQAGETQLSVVSMSALQSFVEDSGKGLFLQHSSADSRFLAGDNPWPWYFTMHPCQYTGAAGAGGKGSVGKIGIWGENNTIAKQHPIMQDIGWSGADPDSLTMSPGLDLFTFANVITDPKIRPANWQGLLGLNPSTCATANTCGDSNFNYTTASSAGGPYGWPISWTFPLKKGSIGVFLEGHDMNTMDDMTQAVWDRFYKQFLYYIAGYDTIVVLAVHSPGSELNMALDQSGITFHPSQAAGVLITKAGFHSVALYDFAGHKIKEERGNKTPVDYNFSGKTNGLKKGFYVMRVVAPGVTRSQRVYMN